MDDRSLPLRGLLLIHIGLLALFVSGAVYAAISNSGVCDELGAHIPAGYLYWTSGQFSGGLSNFPLAQLLIAAPVHWLGYSYELGYKLCYRTGPFSASDALVLCQRLEMVVKENTPRLILCGN